MARGIFRLAIMVSVLFLFVGRLQAQTVTVAWDRNPEPNVRYVVWWGTQHLSYTSSVAAGTATSYTVTGLTPGRDYYFAVQATTVDGLTSPFSEEVSTTIPSNGQPEILFRSQSTGALYRWYMNGTARVDGGSLNPGAVSSDWRVGCLADFNGDGSKDIIWHNQSNGLLYMWTMHGTVQSSAAYLNPGVVSSDWQIRGCGDFDGDGKPDIVWHNQSNGLLYVWFMNGSVRTGATLLNPYIVSTDWQIRGVADFNGDGKPDLLWQNQDTGSLYVWSMNGAARIGGSELTPASVPKDWQIRQVADFNGDGKPDILWQNQASGILYIWFMNGTTRAGAGYPNPPSVPIDWQIVQ